MIFISALLPVIILVTLGQGLKRWHIIEADGWQAIELICFRVLFPAFIVVTLARAPFEGAPWDIIGTMIATQLIMAAITFPAIFLKTRFPKYAEASVATLVQSSVRWNTFIALSIAGSLYGEAGLALIAIIAAGMIPAANLISVWILTKYGNGIDGQKRSLLAELVRNPIVIACALGSLLNFLDLPPVGALGEAFDVLARGAIGLGLLSAGAGIDLGALWRSGARTFIWSAVRLIMMPLIAMTIALWLGLEGMALGCIIISAGVPTAVNGYILARRLGGDATLAANLIAVQTVASGFTLPLIFLLAPV